jgi:hypothetical protein
MSRQWQIKMRKPAEMAAGGYPKLGLGDSRDRLIAERGAPPLTSKVALRATFNSAVALVVA